MSDSSLEIEADLINVEHGREINEDGDILDDSARMVRICLTLKPETIDELTRAIAEEEHDGSAVVYFIMDPKDAIDLAADVKVAAGEE